MFVFELCDLDCIVLTVALILCRDLPCIEYALQAHKMLHIAIVLHLFTNPWMIN